VFGGHEGGEPRICPVEVRCFDIDDLGDAEVATLT